MVLVPTQLKLTIAFISGKDYNQNKHITNSNWWNYSLDTMPYSQMQWLYTSRAWYKHPKVISLEQQIYQYKLIINEVLKCDAIVTKNKLKSILFYYASYSHTSRNSQELSSQALTNWTAKTQISHLYLAAFSRVSIMQVSSSELVYFNWAKGCSKLKIAQASQIHSPSKPNAQPKQAKCTQSGHKRR